MLRVFYPFQGPGTCELVVTNLLPWSMFSDSQYPAFNVFYFHQYPQRYGGVLPFFWIILLLAFLLVAMYSVQYSRRWYKFTLAKLVGYSAALSILLGTLFFISGKNGIITKSILKSNESQFVSVFY